MSVDRRTLMWIALCAVVESPGLGGWLRAQDDSSSGGDLLTPPATQAATRGLRYLRDRQLEAGEVRAGGQADPVAITALSGMAFLASGSTPGRGPFGRPLERCVDFLVETSDANGFLHSPNGGNRPMYGHGFATLFLAEVYGMSSHPLLRPRLAAAVQIIVRSQNESGGWRYEPLPVDADVSVSSAQLIALRAARNAGMNVPLETVERAVGYLTRSQMPNGGFRYMSTVDEAAFPRSAAAVTALLGAGMHDAPEVAKGLDYLQGFRPDPKRIPAAALDAAPEDRYLFYGHYYAAQAMWQAGAAQWRRWYPSIRDLFVAAQRPDGSWASDISPEYATAMASFVLQIPLNSVPVLQR